MSAGLPVPDGQRPVGGRVVVDTDELPGAALVVEPGDVLVINLGENATTDVVEKVRAQLPPGLAGRVVVTAVPTVVAVRGGAS